MVILYALILGVLQGLTEFLPISSSGHLLLFENILGISGDNMFFNVLMHFATLIAVVVIFWKDVVELIKHPFGKRMQAIVIATIPTVILALVVNYFFDEFALSAFLGFGFLISAVVITATSIMQKKRSLNYRFIEVNKKNALLIGIVQGLAVLPGISRSGSTICAGLMLGVEREEAAKFSFLVSIPVIIGGMIFELIGGIKSGFGEVNGLACFVGFVAAFVVALFTIKLMMKIVKKGKWWGFAIYLFILAIFVILNQYVLCLF